MASLINFQNKNPTPPSLTGEIPESTHILSSEDFISKAINIIQKSVQKRDFDQIDVPLKALKAKYSAEAIPSTALNALIERIKDLKLLPQDLSSIYRHLILDLQLTQLDDFSTYDEEFRIALAKLAAQNSPSRLSSTIKKYNIHNQEALVEIAKLVARQDGYTISSHIEDFGIKSQEALVEIAKLAAQENDFAVSKRIKNYGIQSQEALVEIALLIAIEESTFSRFPLNKDNIINSISRFVDINPEIAKNILKQYPELRVLGINDDPDPELQFFLKTDDIQRKELYQKMLIEEDPHLKEAQRNCLRVFCSILDFAHGSSSLLKKFKTLFNSVQEEKNVQVQEQKLSLIASLLMHCRAKNVNKEKLDEQFYLLNEVFTLKAPLLCSYLSHIFIENLTNPALCDFVRKNSSDVSTKKNPYSPAHLTLTLLAPFIAKMVPYVELSFPANKTHVSEEVDLEKVIRYVTFTERMKELLNHKVFKDRIKVQSLLHSLRTLIAAPELSKTAKTSVLRDLIFAGPLISFERNLKDQCEGLLRSAEIVALLIQCGKSFSLTSITSEQLHSQVNQLFASVLKMDVPDNLILNTFAKWRDPSALLSYASSLQSDRETAEKVLPFFIEFAKSVLKSTFFSDRYDSSPSKASEHWLKICEKAPALVKKWKEGRSYSDKGYDVIDTDDPCDLLLSGTEVPTCQKVTGDLLYSKCLVAYLIDPKIRMMAVKNKNGVIITRCMMRMLWDKEAEKFVLFQETTYGGNDFFSSMLDRACKKRAEELGVALLSKASKAPQGLGQATLQAFKGKAPFEYVDRIGAIGKDEGYQLFDCKYIYKPENF